MHEEGARMKRVAGVALVTVVLTLSVAGIGQAQSRVSGTIEGVDCQTNVLIMNAASGVELLSAAPNAAVFINSRPASFCALREYIGSYATASPAAEGSARTVGRVEVLTPPATYDPYGAGYPYYGPFLGVGIPFIPTFNQGGMRRR